MIYHVEIIALAASDQASKDALQKFCNLNEDFKKCTSWINWIECEWTPVLFRGKPGWRRRVVRSDTMKKESSLGIVRLFESEEEERRTAAWMKFTIIHQTALYIFHRRHRSAQDHIPRTRTSPDGSQDTIFSFETFGKRFGMFYTHTHLQLPRWSKDRHYASHL